MQMATAVFVQSHLSSLSQGFEEKKKIKSVGDSEKVKMYCVGEGLAPPANKIPPYLVGANCVRPRKTAGLLYK